MVGIHRSLISLLCGGAIAMLTATSAAAQHSKENPLDDEAWGKFTAGRFDPIKNYNERVQSRIDRAEKAGDRLGAESLKKEEQRKISQFIRTEEQERQRQENLSRIRKEAIKKVREKEREAEMRRQEDRPPPQRSFAPTLQPQPAMPTAVDQPQPDYSHLLPNHRFVLGGLGAGIGVRSGR